MKQLGLGCLLGYFALLMTGAVSANEVKESAKVAEEKAKNDSALNALEAYWVFSGMVSTENGDHYNYYFQMQRKDRHFHAVATLIDSQSKKILLFEEQDATLEQVPASKWQVGKTFMQFNPINNSWVFGVKTKRRGGFNFKVDMLGQALTMPLSQDLRPGVELLINQTGRLNGHLQTGEQPATDQFVTAARAWFKQIWVAQSQASLHPLTGVLCQFNEGSGFFALNLQEPDALRGAIAGWRDAQGLAMPISQFVSIKENEGLWSISIASPKIHLSLQKALTRGSEKHQLIAGLTEGEMPGFCTITKDEIG